MANVDDIVKKVSRQRAQNPQGTEPAKVGEPSSYDKKIERIQKIHDNTLGGITDEQKAFQSAMGTANLSMYDKKLEKLQSYGARYNEYGFNPYLNNEKLYDDLTTTGEQWMRSLKGAGKLMKIGFTDNALFGAFADDDSHKEYSKAVDFYTSSKGGATGFMQNLVLNSGYTVGIIADMVLEEAALLGITALSGGAASGETLPMMGAKFWHAGNALKNFGNIRKAFKATSDLNRTIRTVNKSTKGSNAFLKTAQFLNPLENTTNFVKNLKTMDQLRDMSDVGKFTHGTAALFRDVKATHLAMTEASLESNMLGDELYRHLTSQHEGTLTKADTKYYRKLADEGAFWAYTENVIAIGATNKLVFNNTFKAFDDLKGLGKTIGESRFYKMMKYGKAPTQVIEKGTWKGLKQSTKMIFSDGFGKGMGRIAKTVGSKGGTYFTANLGEGLQENLQEAIHAKNMSQFGNAYHGSYFNSLLHGLEEQFTMQGGSTFLSGFLMGGLISPVNMAVKAGGQFAQGGGYKYFTDGKAYQQTKTSERNKLEADAKKIDQLFEHASDVFKAKGNNLAVQSAMEREMAEARRNDDEFEFKNAQNKSYRSHLRTAMEYGMMDQFKEHLESFKSMTVDEFYEAFPTVSKGMNKAQRDAIIDNKIARADAFVEDYNWVKANIQNPIDLKQIDATDPNYKYVRAYHDYFEQAKEELIFAKHEMVDKLNRREEIFAAAIGQAKDKLFGPSLNRQQAGSEQTTMADYQVLFSPGAINGELKMLKDEIDASDPQLESAEEKALMKQKKARYDKLSRYKESLDEMQEVGALLEEHNLMDEDLMTAKDSKERKRLENWYDQASTRVFNRHNEYLKEITDVEGAAFENFSQESFDRLHDYYRLDTKTAELDNLINVLTNPEMLDSMVQRQVEMHDVHMAQFRRYVENSMAMDRDQDVMQNALADLFKKGIGFPLKYVEWMVERGKLPPVFYDLESGDVLLDTVTNEQAKIEDPDFVGAQIVLTNKEKLKQAKQILQDAYDKLIIKPSEDLKEPTAKEKEQAEKGEDFVDTDQAGGATDRTYKRKGPSVSQEALEQVKETTPLQEYPKEIIEDLIEQYKGTSAAQQLDKDLANLTPDNFTKRFEKWADDKAEAYVESLKKTKEGIRDNFETLNNEQKTILKDEGYSIEDINEMSAPELQELLQGLGTPVTETQTEEETVEEDVEEETTEEEVVDEDVEVEQEEEPAIIVANSVLDEGVSESFEGAIFGEVGNYTDTENAQPRVDEVIQIGQDLDSGKITAEMGPLRAQIDGRLVVQYITSDGRVFFMYKSTGEGTGAESTGEWVPIPGWSGTGWFIKTFYKGKNPKFTKYESETFKQIDENLKATEDMVFDDAPTTEDTTPDTTQDVTEDREVGEMQEELQSLKQQLEDIESAQAETDPVEVVLSGIKSTKITPDSAKKETGLKVGTKGDISLSFVSKDGVTVNELAKTLWEDHGPDGDNTFPNWTDQDWRNQIIDVLNQGSPANARKAIGNFSKKELEGRISLLEKEIGERLAAVDDPTAPDVVGETPPISEQDVQEDAGKEWQERRARDIFEELRSIDTYTTAEGQAKFFERVERELIDFIGRRRFGYEITPEAIADVLNKIKTELELTNDNVNYQMASNYANDKIDRFKNPEKYDQVEKDKQKRLEMMEALGYSTKDIDGFNKKTIDRILTDQITKAQYLDIQTGIKDTQIKEIAEIFKKMDTNVRTPAELAEVRGKFALENPELDAKYPGAVDVQIRSIIEDLVNLKGFENLQEGDIVEMNDGTLRKVSKLGKTQVKLVNYNNIVADEITMKKDAFNKGTRRIVNEFNKDSKGYRSTIEQGNIDQLSDLLSTFTGGAFVATETVPAEEDLKEYFKLCK